jgi:hypothetical protein
MEDRFELLTCNNDVISFRNHTFKIGEFRRKLIGEFQHKEQSNEISRCDSISISGMPIYLGEINWKSSIIDCELLRLGSQSWQKGKFRLQVHIKFRDEDGTRRQGLIEVDLEFCFDEPPISEPESPLDDLRQIINQETQQ